MAQWCSLCSPEPLLGNPSSHPICTKTATIAQRRHKIAHEQLSLTFKDAVNIYRDLGIRYLWIDSLCIIQDDAQDWTKDAAVMASVYGNSYLCLPALSSANSSEGRRIRERNPLRPKLARYEDFCIGSQRIRLFESAPAEWHTDYGDDPYKFECYGSHPLRTRAWTLQERELPVRQIHFSEGQLLWLCATMKGSSELPWYEKKYEHEDNVLQPLALYRGESSIAATQRDRWYGLVEDYSSRFLTKETDKAAAVAGLATNYATVFPQGIYAFGVWTCCLPSALLWRTVLFAYRAVDEPINPLGAFQPRRPQHPRSPSWPWKSLHAEINYSSQRVEGYVGDISGIWIWRLQNLVVMAHGAEEYCRS